MAGLQIPTPTRRLLVRAAVLSPRRRCACTANAGGQNRARVLLLRLERIGDLLMVLDAIGDCAQPGPTPRSISPSAAGIAIRARSSPASGSTPLDVPWLARDGGGTGRSRRSRGKRVAGAAGYDLVINFEPDIRSNFLAWLTGAPRASGTGTGGGGALLTDAVAYEPTRHVSRERATTCRDSGRASAPPARSARRVDGSDRACNCRRTPRARGGAPRGAARPLIGVHASGGRESKQWHLDRFAASARHLRRPDTRPSCSPATADRPLVDEVRRALAEHSRRRRLRRPRSATLAALLRTRRARHRRHRADAPRCRDGHAGRRAVRPVDPRRYGRSASGQSRASRRSAVQPVRPGPPAARALSRSRARLPGRHRRRARRALPRRRLLRSALEPRRLCCSRTSCKPC